MLSLPARATSCGSTTEGSTAEITEDNSKATPAEFEAIYDCQTEAALEAVTQ
jgi:hypothetical protein